MLELQAQLSKLESEKLELNTRRSLLESACRLRDEELTKVDDAIIKLCHPLKMLTHGRSVWTCHSGGICFLVANIVAHNELLR